MNDTLCVALLPMVSPTIKAVVVDAVWAVWAVWSIAASVYDYMNKSPMEHRVHALENVIGPTSGS